MHLWHVVAARNFTAPVQKPTATKPTRAKLDQLAALHRIENDRPPMPVDFSKEISLLADSYRRKKI